MIRARFAVAAVLLCAACNTRVADPVRKPPVDRDADPCGMAAAGGNSGTGGGVAAPSPMEPLPLDEGPVVTPTRPPPPVSGGTLTVLADGSFAAADPDRDVLWLVGSDRSTIRRVDFQAGDEPGRVVEGVAGRVFVAMRSSGEVAEVDVASATLVTRYSVCGGPRGLAWVASASSLAVACSTGTLVRLNFEAQPTGAPVFRSMSFSHPAPDLRDVVSVGGLLYVTTFRTGQVFTIDAAGNALELQMPNIDNGVSARTVAWRMSPTPQGVAITHQWSSAAQILEGKPSACIAPDGVPNAVDGAGSPEYGAQQGDVRGLVHGGLTMLNSQGSNESLIGLSAAPIGVDVAVAASGDWAMATVDSMVAGNAQGIYATFDPVGQPISVAWAGTTVVGFSREPAMMLFWNDPAHQQSFTALNLPGASVRSTGHELFYRRTLSGLACASCHPEAGDDGRVWLLPEGPRRTPSLRGGIATTAPFHWAGDLTDMQSLMDEVMVKRMGGNPQSPARVGALLAWLDAQPARPAPDGIDPDAQLRGKALFESPGVGCTGCHVGLQGSNNSNANVGTGGQFQVPRLRELGLRAPYFHDGRISTLEERFLPIAGGELHGHVAQLSLTERTDLVAYLRSL